MRRPRSTALGFLLSLSLASGAFAAPASNGTAASTPTSGDTAQPAPASPSLSDLGRSLRNYFTEDELTLLFEYMRDSVIASFKGEEVSLPPDLSFKLEILLVRLKKEGGHYMDNLIKQLEKDLERNLKEKLKPPEPPATPVYTPPEPPALVPYFPPPPVYQTPPVFFPPFFQPASPQPVSPPAVPTDP
jgi:hypothetical protein